MISLRVEKGAKIEWCMMGSNTPIEGIVRDVYQNLAGGITVIFEPSREQPAQYSYDKETDPVKERSWTPKEDGYAQNLGLGAPLAFSERQGQPEKKGENVLLSSRFRNRQAEIDDERQAERAEQGLADALAWGEYQRAIARMTCKHDVRIFRLKQEVTNFIAQNDKTQKDMFLKIRNIEEAMTRFSVDITSKLQTIPTERIWGEARRLSDLEENVKSLYKLFEEIRRSHDGWIRSAFNQQKQEIDALTGWLSRVEKQTKAIQSRLAKDWDKKRR